MKYEEAMNRCVIVRDSLISGSPIKFNPTIENIEWITMCADAIESHIASTVQETYEQRDWSDEAE